MNDHWRKAESVSTKPSIEEIGLTPEAITDDFQGNGVPLELGVELVPLDGSQQWLDPIMLEACECLEDVDVPRGYDRIDRGQSFRVKRFGDTTGDERC